MFGRVRLIPSLRVRLMSLRSLLAICLRRPFILILLPSIVMFVRLRVRIAWVVLRNLLSRLCVLVLRLWVRRPV